jgi:hypothetical protein
MAKVIVHGLRVAMSGLASPRDDADEPDGELSWNRG